ncbi:MAG: hypothetical protein ACRC1G_12320 [Bradyrhizobium sp.]|nr:hypothetical protein [Bradyrhizobium sp.]
MTVSMRRACRDDVEAIVKLLADDALCGPRERLERPLPGCYFDPFERVDGDANLLRAVRLWPQPCRHDEPILMTQDRPDCAAAAAVSAVVLSVRDPVNNR